MNALVEIAEKLGGASDIQQQTRGHCTSLLSELEHNLRTAARLCSEAIEQSSRDAGQFTFVLWFGAERAKALHKLHLEQRRLGQELTELSGVEFADSMGIIEPIDVVEAYVELSKGESSTERARAAIETLTRRSAGVNAAIMSLGGVQSAR